MVIYARNPGVYEFDPRFEFRPGAVVVLQLGAGTGAAGLGPTGTRALCRRISRRSIRCSKPACVRADIPKVKYHAL